jgi:Fe-S cluster biogenesis protein NfuA
MLQGVQTMLVDNVPGVTNVIDATDHSTGENPYYS